MKRLWLLLAVLGLGCAALAQSSGNATDIKDKIAQARVLQDKGRTEAARKVYEGLLPTLRSIPPSKELGEVLTALGKVEVSAGNYDAAMTLTQESADVYRRIGDQSGEARALNAKGIAAVNQGAYAAAQLTFEKALVIGRQANDTENQVQVLNNLGSAYYYQGKYTEATRSYLGAAHILQTTTAEWRDYWQQITDFNQATLDQRLGRYQNALEIYKRVESSSKGLSASDRAHVLANLGTLYRRLGDPWKALDSYRAAQKLYATDHDADGEIGVLKNIGIVYALDQKDLASARSIFQRCLVLAKSTNNRREQMQAYLYLGEAALRENSLADAREAFVRAKSLAAELATTEEQWKAGYGLGRVDESSGNWVSAEDQYREAISIIEKSRAKLQISSLRSDFLADKRDVYDSLISLLLAQKNTKETFLFLERSRARNFQDRLTGVQSAAVRPLTLEETRSRLNPQTLLLELWTAGNRLAYVWCTREQDGMVVRDLTEKEVASVRDFLSGMPQNLDAHWREQVRELDPIFPAEDLPLSKDVQHLVIVLDGWLSYVPFDLLHDRSAADQLLIERFDIAYLPSAALLRRSPGGDPIVHVPWTRQLVAFGDPIISASVDSGTRGDSSDPQKNAPRLPYSGEEIRSIARMAAGRSDLFLQQTDLKKWFLNGTSNSGQLLHVSTHAFADGDNPEQSRLLFSAEQPGQGDDYVFLRELADMDLGKVRLATISACDTEKGKMVRGEGVQAFSRALLAAGARSSITALWRVDDQGTEEFMKQFYFNVLEQRQPKAVALRAAKLKFLHSNTAIANPRYWAAFVLNGDGANPLPRVLSWRVVLLSAAAVAVIVIVLWGSLRSRRGIDRRHASI
jgi:CHAT domain-containing protein